MSRRLHPFPHAGVRRALLTLVIISSGLAGCAPSDDPPSGDPPPVDPPPVDPPPGSGPMVSPEIGLDAPVPGLPAPGRFLAGIAFDGAQHLVVWEDHRAPLPAIYAARVDGDGDVLDPVGVRVADGQNPSVAAGAGGFLVTFKVRPGSPGAQSPEIRAARVTPEGAVLDPGGFSLGEGTGSWERAPSVAFDGAGFVVVWSRDVAGGKGLFRARVTPEGAVLDPGGELTASDGGAGRGAVAFDGAATLVTWIASDRSLHGARITPEGALLDPSGFLIEGAPGPEIVQREAPVAAFDGAHHVIAWAERRGSDSQSWIRARRFTTGGAPLDPASLVVFTEQEPALVLDRLAVAFDGASTLLAWDRSHEESAASTLRLARLSPEGTVLDPVPALLAEGATLPALAPGGAGALAVWTGSLEGSLEGTSLVGARLDPQGAPLDAPPLAISTSANAETEPTVAFDGENFFVAWTDNRHHAAGDRMDVVGARVSPEGALLEPSGIPLASGVPSQRRPIALFDGQSTVVLWLDDAGACQGDGCPNPGVRGARITPEGAVLDAQPISLLDHDYSYGAGPLLAGSAGGATLLATREMGENVALQLSQSGMVTGPSPLGASLMDAVPRAFASDGLDHLVILAAPFTPLGIVGEWVSPGGALVEPGAFTITADPVLLRSAAATCGGGICLVVWDGYEAGGTPTVRAARVTRAGEVLDPQGVVLSASAHLAGCGYAQSDLGDAAPAVVFDGESFVVAWREPSIHCDAGSIALRGSLIGQDGVAGATFTISAEAGIEGPPALASTGAGETLVAYARLLDEAPYGAQRVRLRRITAGAGETP